MAKINKIKEGFKLLTGRAMYVRADATPTDYMKHCFEQTHKHCNISLLCAGAGALLCYIAAQEAFKSGMYQGAADATAVEGTKRIKELKPEETEKAGEEEE